MPKLTDKIGSGMTERVVVEYDWNEPGDVDAQIQAAITTFQRSSFAKLFDHLTQLAAAILEKADLPSDPEKQYLFSPEKGWAVIEEDMDLGPELANAHLTLGRVMEFCKVPPDLPEGYAARVLMLLRQAKEQLQTGSHDEAMASAFAAGALVNEAAMKGVFEKDYLVGADARDRMRKVHEQEYGTSEERQSRDQAIRQAFASELIKGTRKMKAYALLARGFRVDESTVRRAVRQKKNQG